MRILFLIAVLSFVVLAAAAVQIARHLRRSPQARTRTRLQPPARSL